MEGKDCEAINFYESWERLVFIDYYQYLVVKVQLRSVAHLDRLPAMGAPRVDRVSASPAASHNFVTG